MNTINNANPESLFALGGRQVQRMNSLGLSQDRVNDITAGRDEKYWTGFDLIARGIYTPPITVPNETALMLGDWRSFYRRFFKIDLKLSELRIPAHIEGFDRLIIIPTGISIDLVVRAHIDRSIPFWKWCAGNLESVMQESERGVIKTSRVLWVRDGQEADEELKNLSAEMIAEQKIDTENLFERLVHGLKFYDETGEHLDVTNVTLCAGSRYAVGDVPRVHRGGDGEVDIDGFHPSSRYPWLRARQTVRCPCTL